MGGRDCRGENDDLPEDVENAKKLLTRIEQAQETGRAEVMYEPEVEEAKLRSMWQSAWSSL